MHNAKNSILIIGAAVYIGVNEKYTIFCIYRRTLPKIHIASKKGSNKCCSELNFVQRSPRAHMSISPQSGAKGLQRYLYYNVETQKSRFTLGLDAVKNTHLPKIRITSKKGSNKCCLELNFLGKYPRAHVSICHPSPHTWGAELRGLKD